jgi:hypothetical protein
MYFVTSSTVLYHSKRWPQVIGPVGLVIRDITRLLAWSDIYIYMPVISDHAADDGRKVHCGGSSDDAP